MNDQEILLAEYQANIELWQHDDNLRQRRNGTFLNTNSIYIVALSLLVATDPPLITLAVMATLVSIFGFSICLLWHFIQIRNAEYIRFRRFQLRSIENSIKTVSTFTRQWLALNKHEEVMFGNIDEKFIITPKAKLSTTTSLEGNLPFVTAAFWLLVFLSGASVLVFNALHLI